MNNLKDLDFDNIFCYLLFCSIVFGDEKINWYLLLSIEIFLDLFLLMNVVVNFFDVKRFVCFFIMDKRGLIIRICGCIFNELLYL